MKYNYPIVEGLECMLKAIVCAGSAVPMRFHPMVS